MQPIDKPYTLLPTEREAVRKGGSIIHVLPVNENGKADRLAAALCGDRPKEGRHGCFVRAGWYGSTRPVTCKKCLAILAEREATQCSTK